MTRQQLQSGKYCVTRQNWPPSVTCEPPKSLGPFGYEKKVAERLEWWEKRKAEGDDAAE